MEAALGHVQPEIQEWAREEEVEDLLPKLIRNGYTTPKVIASVDASDLDSMGFELLGDRKRILMAVKALQHKIVARAPLVSANSPIPQPVAADPNPSPPLSVVQQQVASYVQPFRQDIPSTIELSYSHHHHHHLTREQTSSVPSPPSSAYSPPQTPLQAMTYSPAVMQYPTAAASYSQPVTEQQRREATPIPSAVGPVQDQAMGYHSQPHQPSSSFSYQATSQFQPVAEHRPTVASVGYHSEPFRGEHATSFAASMAYPTVSHSQQITEPRPTAIDVSVHTLNQMVGYHSQPTSEKVSLSTYPTTSQHQPTTEHKPAGGSVAVHDQCMGHHSQPFREKTSCASSTYPIATSHSEQVTAQSPTAASVGPHGETWGNHSQPFRGEQASSSAPMTHPTTASQFHAPTVAAASVHNPLLDFPSPPFREQIGSSYPTAASYSQPLTQQNPTPPMNTAQNLPAVPHFQPPREQMGSSAPQTHPTVLPYSQSLGGQISPPSSAYSPPSSDTWEKMAPPPSSNQAPKGFPEAREMSTLQFPTVEMSSRVSQPTVERTLPIMHFPTPESSSQELREQIAPHPPQPASYSQPLPEQTRPSLVPMTMCFPGQDNSHVQTSSSCTPGDRHSMYSQPSFQTQTSASSSQILSRKHKISSPAPRQGALWSSSPPAVGDEAPIRRFSSAAFSGSSHHSQQTSLPHQIMKGSASLERHTVPVMLTAVSSSSLEEAPSPSAAAPVLTSKSKEDVLPTILCKMKWKVDGMAIKPEKRPDLLEEFLDKEEYLDIKARIETIMMLNYYQPVGGKSFLTDKKKLHMKLKKCMRKTVDAVQEYVDEVNKKVLAGRNATLVFPDRTGKEVLRPEDISFKFKRKTMQYDSDIESSEETESSESEENSRGSKSSKKKSKKKSAKGGKSKKSSKSGTSSGKTRKSEKEKEKKKKKQRKRRKRSNSINTPATLLLQLQLQLQLPPLLLQLQLQPLLLLLIHLPPLNQMQLQSWKQWAQLWR